MGDCMAPHSEPSAIFVAVCYALCAVVLVVFGATAVWVSSTMPSATKDNATFITARGSQPFWRMAWSFYASAIGAWAAFLPASYTSFGGWVSIITYAVATGLPIFLVAEWGALILKACPDVTSLNDFAGRRYGSAVKLFVILLSLINMCVCLVAEYTAIGDLFEFYVGGERLGVVIFVGTVTAIYTSAGGLLVSIITDQGQAVLSLLLIVVAVIYLAVGFRCPLPHTLPPNLAVNDAGLSSIWSLTISLISSTIYSEAFWQRVWAAHDTHALRWGAVTGFGLTVIVIAFFGFTGFLGLWAGMPPLDEYNNLAFFVPFAYAQPWVRVLLVILTATMNESAVDSFQNAIVATLASNFMMDKPVYWTRLLVFLINIPLIAVALQGYSLLDIFLIMNVITTCCTFPLLSGLWLQAVSGVTVLVSCLMAVFWTCVFGCLHVGDFKLGIAWTFSSLQNMYDYRLFLVGFFASVGHVILGWATWDRGLHKQDVGDFPSKQHLEPIMPSQQEAAAGGAPHGQKTKGREGADHYQLAAMAVA